MTAEGERQPGIAVQFLFRGYRAVISPVLHVLSPTRCVYLPTCSEYAYVAVARFGMLKGTWLALRRVARCHPFAKGGLDPVPERNQGLPPGIGRDHLA